MNEFIDLICPICGKEEKSPGGIIVVEKCFESMEEMVKHIWDCHCPHDRELGKCFCGSCIGTMYKMPAHIHQALKLPKEATIIQPWHIAQHYTDFLMGACETVEDDSPPVQWTSSMQTRI